ncbi:MAG TPA: YndJ family transporter [Candidatus Dormibacteraeota bacterium]|nr:YndJ family transporter [Candidatus Dormibacteraeota bacterium]
MTSAFLHLIGNLSLVDLLLLLAPVVIVPLGLRLVAFTRQRARQVLALARVIQPAGAAAAFVSFLTPAGWTAGVIALGWLLVCGIAALAGLIELVESRSLRPIHLVPAASAAYLSVGAGWLVVSRAGLRPLGFSPDIVELTGIHFHYAGFAATLMAALTMMTLRDRARLAQIARVAALLIVAGVPITAAGIATSSGLATVLGPVLLGTGVLSIAGLTGLAIAPHLESRLARALLWVSAAGVVLPMLLGVDYAISRVFPIPALDLRAMALIHGDLNALAFGLAGILGWTVVGLSQRPKTA